MKISASARGDSTNLLQIYANATLATRQAGQEWYRQANAACAELAATYQTPLPTTIAIVAALSPGVAWDKNLAAAETVLNHAVHHQPLTPMSTYGQNTKRAIAIATSNDVNLLRGQKVTAFYANILHPETSGPITVDRHMVRAWLGTPTRGAFDIKPKLYDRIAVDIAAAADATPYRPHEFQAIVWLQIRTQ